MHPPYQIDCNFGYPAGVNEMLVQSHMGYIHLLPALPEAWSAGNVHGLRARGGFELDMYWDKGRLIRAEIRNISGAEAKCEIRHAKGSIPPARRRLPRLAAGRLPVIPSAATG